AAPGEHDGERTGAAGEAERDHPTGQEPAQRHERKRSGGRQSHGAGRTCADEQTCPLGAAGGALGELRAQLLDLTADAVADAVHHLEDEVSGRAVAGSRSLVTLRLVAHRALPGCWLMCRRLPVSADGYPPPQVMFDPDIVVEIFVFDSTGRDDDRTATAEGQRRDDRTGEATDEEALDAPSGAGG
ncbi:MAG TPA: hypothetical protein VGO81_13165, partial [Solirubrobacteraceae bacterium]|nr:hypothetical protein [Solirubrobacteraceae bacterium]